MVAQYRLTVRAHFDAAHRLPFYSGKCFNIHGHRWVVEATWKFSSRDRRTGMCADFKELKTRLEKVCKEFDHTFLNNFLKNPTAEALAKCVFEELSKKPPSKLLLGYLVSVRVDETPESTVVYAVE
jgi:6-pyruvoyltetrahydropterin/6-carboxytetrahydropterin synthase